MLRSGLSQLYYLYPVTPQPRRLSPSIPNSPNSEINLNFQPNSLKWPSSNGFCPMFCLALSNKRSILVVCGNYNVSYSMLLGRVGHTRSFLRIFAILRHLHQHCRHLRGQCLHASCIIDQTAGHLSGIKIQAKIDHRNVEIFQITVTHIGNCTNQGTTSGPAISGDGYT